ncbi:MAG: hypothetical protein ACPGVL_02030 [Pseudoalteromonas spongiae]|jgi:hypothetical protein|uniref:Orphan protein n=1 Tax=Pseudoalteromonas spongiae TaxID=298657 RepID=A0ABU8ERG3_9GAMM|nr:MULTISPECIES: hypothetical protein [Pseudoalteromonas]ATC98786.1 hypothetical protein PSPO_a1740 [Pseudoalteromonas spongiae UST010723-006]MCF6458005.1 hypothetical protein [Pseudoalteromonas sp. MMG024]
MKDWLSVQDYLFGIDQVGDWEGQEETVAENLNELIHVAWQQLPDETDADTIDKIIEGIWQHLRGDTAILEAEHEELIDWVLHYVTNQLENNLDEEI